MTTCSFHFFFFFFCVAVFCFFPFVFSFPYVLSLSFSFPALVSKKAMRTHHSLPSFCRNAWFGNRGGFLEAVANHPGSIITSDNNRLSRGYYLDNHTSYEGGPKWKMSVLHFACMGGDPDTVRDILAMDEVDVNKPGLQGRVPLQVALDYFRSEAAMVLVNDPRVVVDPPQLRPFILGDLQLAQEELASAEVDLALWTSFFFASNQMGHLHLVNLLLAHTLANVNCKGPGGVTLLQCAAKTATVSAVRMLLTLPGIDVNYRTKSSESPLFSAARSGSTQAFRLLLHDPRVKVEWGSSAVKSVAGLGCEKGQEKILWELALSPRVDLNASIVKHSAIMVPLWMVASKAQLASVKALLASPKEIRTSHEGQGIVDRLRDKPFKVTDHQAIIDLIGEYEANPGKVRRRLWHELQLEGDLAALLFATTVMVCDGYLELVGPSSGVTEASGKKEVASDTLANQARRFFCMITKLPMELQMVVCNQVYGLAEDTIPASQREGGFVVCVAWGAKKKSEL